MPFSVNSAFNETTDWILTADIPRAIASSPLYTGFIITTLVVLIAWFVFPRLGRPRRIAKFWVFSLVGVTGLMFIHNKILFAERDEVAAGSVVDSVMSGARRLDDSVGVPLMPVKPGSDFNLSAEEDHGV